MYIYIYIHIHISISISISIIYIYIYIYVYTCFVLRLQVLTGQRPIRVSKVLDASEMRKRGVLVSWLVLLSLSCI